MNYVIAYAHNGEILRSYAGRLEDLVNNLPAGEIAVPGEGSWLTHRVVDGDLVELPARRVPPFDGAHWDPQAGHWFDPMGVAELKQGALADKRRLILDQIVSLEAQQQRPIREVTEAWLAGTEPPKEAAAIVLHIASSIRALRDSLKGLQE